MWTWLHRYHAPQFDQLPSYEAADEQRKGLHPLPTTLAHAQVVFDTAVRRADDLQRAEQLVDKKAADLLTLCVALASVTFGAARWLPLDCPPLIVGFLAPLCWATFNLMLARRGLRHPALPTVAQFVAEQRAQSFTADQVLADLALTLDLTTVGRTAILSWRSDRFDEAIFALFASVVALPLIVLADHFFF